MPRTLHLYGHADCSLCDRLEAMLRPHTEAGRLVLEKRDITADRAWLRRYRERIPVLTDEDGHVLVEGRPEAEQVAAALRAAMGG